MQRSQELNHEQEEARSKALGKRRCLSNLPKGCLFPIDSYTSKKIEGTKLALHSLTGGWFFFFLLLQTFAITIHLVIQTLDENIV